MKDGEQIEIQFTPAEAERFRAWQAEQRADLAARQAAREAERREPWESDPDSWRDQ